MNKYVIVVWIEILVFTISCRDGCEIQTKVSWKDSLFLEVKGDIRDLSSWSDTDINYYFAAEKRLNIHEEEGRFVWEARKGADVNISEEIYGRIVKEYNKYNRRLATGKYKIERNMAVTIDSLPEDEIIGFYADSTFLRINGDLMDSRTIWDNVAIYRKALLRLERHLRIENNRFKWEVKEGAELRITQNIFDYVIDRWEECNDLLETGRYEIEREMKSGRFYVVPKSIYITREKAYTPFFRKASRE